MANQNRGGISIGVYPKKLLFFLILGLMAFGGYEIYQGYQPPKIAFVQGVSASQGGEAAASLADNLNMSQDYGNYYLELNLKDDGSVYIGDKKIREGIQARSDRDELRYVILDQPKNNYTRAEITLNLPKKLNKLVGNPQIIAVHGASPLSAELLGDKIVYRAENVTSGSTVTIVAGLPKGYLDLSASRAISSQISSIPGLAWIIASLVFPPFALIIFVLMIFRHYGIKLVNTKVEGMLARPPSEVAPAVVSVLEAGRVGPRTIMATLVDLAHRGYIDIYNRGEDFMIYLRPVDKAKAAKLKIYEAILLEKIFLPQQQKIGAIDVEVRMSRHLFSRKVAIFFYYIYNEAQSLGYFDESPTKIHLNYRLTGIFTFFFGLIGYIIAAFFSPDPKFTLFFWVAMIILGILIINFAPKITKLSKRGEAARQDWLKFKNMLAQAEIFRGDSSIYEKYLPYAVAMGVEAQWSARFVEAAFAKPEWYEYAGQIQGVENFAKTLLPIVDYIADSLGASGEPLVK